MARMLWHLGVFLVLMLGGGSKSDGSSTETTSGSDNDILLSVFDLVEECDLLAAHPDDPRRMAEGVADDLIVPRLAIMACEDALKRNPDDNRFVFQLGRAQLAIGNQEEAVKNFQKASDNGYAAAHGYLGDAYQFGWSVPVNISTAQKHYEASVRGGFLIAQGQIEQLHFDQSKFVVGSIIEAVYRGDLTTLHSQSAQPKARNFLFNFVSKLGEECTVLKPRSVSGFYRYRFPSDWTEESDDIGIAIQTSVGEHDGTEFLRHYGCESPVALETFTNLNTFFQN